ncbi:hypothetical protein E3P92_00329 [Wallemia ichthyophaga]|nr:hypothetical protein E3P92_00329 [Wallemia ichthyophaga]TIB37434.1 hypothetical protein E3P84_00208 [Wallemia ichthyophaga]TIB44349.1 hypothetical protein E3P83_00208 [Wallemia ichthyophaga]
MSITSDSRSFISAESKAQPSNLVINVDYSPHFIRSYRECIADLHLQSYEIDSHVDSPRLMPTRNTINTAHTPRHTNTTQGSILDKLNNVQPISTQDLMLRIRPQSASTDHLISLEDAEDSEDAEDAKTKTDHAKGSVDFRHDILYQAINASFGDTTPNNFLNTDPSKSLSGGTRHSTKAGDSNYSYKSAKSAKSARSTKSLKHTPTPTTRTSSLLSSPPKSTHKPQMGVQVTHLKIPQQRIHGTPTIHKSLSTPLLSDQDSEVLDSPTPPPVPMKEAPRAKTQSYSCSSSAKKPERSIFNEIHAPIPSHSRSHSPTQTPTPALKTSAIDRRNRPPALELRQSTHRQIESKLGCLQEQKKAQERSEKQSEVQSQKQDKHNSHKLPPDTTTLPSEHPPYLPPPPIPPLPQSTAILSNSFTRSVPSRLKDAPKLTRMRSETLPSPTTPIHSIKHRPTSSPTTTDQYSVTRLRGMLEQHVAQERSMWHSITSNTRHS